MTPTLPFLSTKISSIVTLWLSSPILALYVLPLSELVCIIFSPLMRTPWPGGMLPFWSVTSRLRL